MIRHSIFAASVFALGSFSTSVFAAEADEYVLEPVIEAETALPPLETYVPAPAEEVYAPPVAQEPFTEFTSVPEPVVTEEYFAPFDTQPVVTEPYSPPVAEAPLVPQPSVIQPQVPVQQTYLPPAPEPVPVYQQPVTPPTGGGPLAPPPSSLPPIDQIASATLTGTESTGFVPLLGVAAPLIAGAAGVAGVAAAIATAESTSANNTQGGS